MRNKEEVTCKNDKIAAWKIAPDSNPNPNPNPGGNLLGGGEVGQFSSHRSSNQNSEVNVVWALNLIVMNLNNIVSVVGDFISQSLELKLSCQPSGVFLLTLQKWV